MSTENQDESVRVLVRESIERFSDVILDDGSILQVKAVVLDARRLPDDVQGSEGGPVYHLRTQTVALVKQAGPSFTTTEH